MQGVARSKEEIEETKQKILDYIAGGIGRTFLGACQVSGVGMSEAYTWRNEDEEFEKGVAVARRTSMEAAIDLAENKSLSILDNGDPKHVRWFLETRGKNRGYSKRLEQTGADGAPLNPMTEPLPAASEQEGLEAVAELAKRPPPSGS